MRKLILSTLLSSLLGSATLSAQLYVLPDEGTLTGVSNDGLAIGTTDQNTPYFLWDPFTGEKTVIGGISSGNGIGGVGCISADGTLAYAGRIFDHLPVSTSWHTTMYPEFDYQINGFMRPSTMIFLATGVRKDGKGSIVLESTSGDGKLWKSNVSGDVFDDVRITSCGYAGPYTIFVGCEGGLMYSSKGNSSWLPYNPRPKDDETKVKAITAMDFTKLVGSIMTFDGAVGFEGEDGSFGVWYTKEATTRYADFAAAQNVAGIPTAIRENGNVFFMTTRNGHIQKSTDGGMTWETIFSTEKSLFRIEFANDQNGVALSENSVFVTSDGGENWEETVVLDSENVTLNDISIADGIIYIAASEGKLYASDDNGKTFEIIRGLPAEYAKCDFRVVDAFNDVVNIGSDNGRFFYKSFQQYVEAETAARYNIITKEWDYLDNLGAFTTAVTQTASSVDGVSDDGRYAVGLAYCDNEDYNNHTGNPVLWDNCEIIPLSNMFVEYDRNAKATAVSADGSVVVGWQDKLGPWMASVWRRQEDGSYVQSLMFKDKETTIEDIDFDNFDDVTANCLGSAMAVSSNGKWIGGMGGGEWYALKEAWIWSEETGYILLGDAGTTMAVSDDGSTAIGYGAMGLGGWIWTKEEGMKMLNNVASDLGATPTGFEIMSAYSMSANGRYVVGWGMTGDIRHGYVLDLKHENSHTETIAEDLVNIAVYPNPAVNELRVDLPASLDKSSVSISLYTLNGVSVADMTTCDNSNVIDTTGLQAGIYILSVRTPVCIQTHKVIIK